MTDTMLLTPSGPLPKKLRSSDYAVSIIHPEGDFEIDSSQEYRMEVFAISHTIRKVTDPEVSNRNCVVADSSSVNPLRVKGSLLRDIEGLHLSYMEVVCFEAYKVLEKDFSDILHSLGSMKEHAVFVKKFRMCAEKAAKFHKVSIPKNKEWIKYLPFGAFAEGLGMLNLIEVDSAPNKKKLSFLAKTGKLLFKEVVLEAINLLESSIEDSSSLNGALEKMKESTIELLPEFILFARMRRNRNTVSHPFDPYTSGESRRVALEFYSRCLQDDFTKDFRQVAYLAKLKLDNNELKFKENSSKRQKIDPSEIFEDDDASSYIDGEAGGSESG